MELLDETIERELPDLAKQGVRTRFFGRRDRIPAELQEKMAHARARDRASRHASSSGSRSTTAVAPSSSRRRAGCSRTGSHPDDVSEEAHRRSPLRARAPRARPRDPHVGRAARSRTSCSGSRRTPSSSSTTRCGPTSARSGSAPPSTSTRAARRRFGAHGEPACSRGSSSRRSCSRSSSASSTWAAGGSSGSRSSAGLLALHELYVDGARPPAARARRLPRASSLTLLGLQLGGLEWMLGGLLATFVLRVRRLRPRRRQAVRDDVVRRDAARRRVGREPGSAASCSSATSRSSGFWAVMAVLFTVFAADTGAFFVGRTFGRHQPRAGDLAEEVVGGASSAACSRRSGWRSSSSTRTEDFLSIPESLLLGLVDRARGGARRPVRVGGQARSRGEGLGPPARRARRHARPARFAALGRPRRVLHDPRVRERVAVPEHEPRLAFDACASDESPCSGRPDRSGARRSR